MQLTNFLQTNPKKILIFDFDETIAKILIDWSEWHLGIFDIYKKYDPEWEFEGQGGGFRMDLYINEFTRRFGEKIHEELDAFNREYEQAKKTGYTKNPELIEFIRDDETYQKFLYTSNAGVTVLPIVEELGLIQKFEGVVTRDEVTLIKPDPEGMRLILDPARSIEEYLMIGDSTSDEGVAKAMEMDFFKVTFFK